MLKVIFVALAFNFQQRENRIHFSQYVHASRLICWCYDAFEQIWDNSSNWNVCRKICDVCVCVCAKRLISYRKIWIMIQLISIDKTVNQAFLTLETGFSTENTHSSTLKMWLHVSIDWLKLPIVVAIPCFSQNLCVSYSFCLCFYLNQQALHHHIYWEKKPSA